MTCCSSLSVTLHTVQAITARVIHRQWTALLNDDPETLEITREAQRQLIALAAALEKDAA